MSDDTTNADKLAATDELDAFALGLTAKQQLFAQNYVILLNGTRAAKAAGYSADSESSLAWQASTNLRNPKIKRYIEKLFAAGKMGKDEVIGRLQALANADIGNYLQVVKVIRNGVEQDEWRFNLVKAINDGNTSLIKSIKRDKFGVVVELHDKVRTLELIGKHHRLFADVTIAGDKPDQTAEALPDDDLAAIASQAHNVRDAVDAFEAEDKASLDIDAYNRANNVDGINDSDQ
jgi:phage terminase small subunit